jgi:SAM-dependent methyltransferase
MARGRRRQDSFVAPVAQHVWGTAPAFVGPRHELREKLLLRELLAVGPGREILNAGAGLGSFTALLEGRGFSVTSSDVSEPALHHLSARVDGPVVRADLTKLPFAAESFDAVVLGEVLEHVEDDRAALTDVHRVLRPGGTLALSVPANPAWFGPSDAWAGHFRRYTRTDLVEKVMTARFDGIRCVGWGFPVSAAYHRAVFDRRAERLAGEGRPRGWKAVAVAGLRAALQIDRAFVGVERGALGLLLTARRG